MGTDEPFALLISWTCYGNWLPGDPRGYVSNTLRPGGGYDPKQNQPGTPVTANDPDTFHRARELQKWPTVRLDVEQARVAAESMVEATRQRGWRIVRAAIMANHVHVVVMNCPDDGPGVRRILKGCSQAALSRVEGKPRRWWTDRGSDRYRHGFPSVEATIQYVADQEYILVEIVDMEVRIVGAKSPSAEQRPREENDPPG